MSFVQRLEYFSMYTLYSLFGYRKYYPMIYCNLNGLQSNLNFRINKFCGIFHIYDSNYYFPDILPGNISFSYNDQVNDWNILDLSINGTDYTTKANERVHL